MENMNLSDKSKAALKSETWQELGEALREEIVKEYLKTGYTDESKQHDIEVSGTTYKVLERGEITTFYDGLGNTLFNVENKELAAKYDNLAKAGNEPDSVDEKEGNSDVAEEENIDLGQEEENSEAGEAQEEKQSEDEKETAPDDGADNDVISSNQDKELPAPAAAEIADSKKEDGRPAKLVAKEKLQNELKGAKDKNFAEPIIGYLLKRCEEDEGVAEDVAQEHKTWDKCIDYIYKQARKQATGNHAAVRDDVVYEWAEDYYHKDDKAEEAEKAKKEAEAKVKSEKAAEKKKTVAKSKSTKTAVKPSTDRNKAKDPVKEERSKEQPKPKKSGKDMEGQLDMFSMMGM